MQRGILVDQLRHRRSQFNVVERFCVCTAARTRARASAARQRLHAPGLAVSNSPRRGRSNRPKQTNSLGAAFSRRVCVSPCSRDDAGDPLGGSVRRAKGSAVGDLALITRAKVCRPAWPPYGF